MCAPTVGEQLPARLRAWGVAHVYGDPGDGSDQQEVDLGAARARRIQTGLGYRAPVVVPPHDELRRAADILNAGAKVALLAGRGARDPAARVVGRGRAGSAR